MPVTVPDNVLTVNRARLGGFFLLFARFEFALKAAGFAKAGRYGAEVDWEKTSAALAERVLPLEGYVLLDAIAYLEASPPRQQKLTNNNLHWEARPAPKTYSRVRALIFYVMGTRNNLMHGAKFLEKEAEDPDRDRKLLEAAETVIAACLDNIPGLKDAFESDAL